MICHRTIGPEVVHPGEDCIGRYFEQGRAEPYPSRCLGSRCALWSTIQRTDGGGYEPCKSGEGVCADNLFAIPWTDPAAKEPT